MKRPAAAGDAFRLNTAPCRVAEISADSQLITDDKTCVLAVEKKNTSDG